MDASEDEREDRTAAGASGRDERGRAVAYLDLWERHVWLMAMDGALPWSGNAAHPRDWARDRARDGTGA